MKTLGSTPLQRAQTRCEELEARLRRSPDFQLYLITKGRRERARMERWLMEIPEFKLWHMLANTIRRAQRELVAASVPAGITQRAHA
jgi:hypothetical protein